MKPKLDFTHYLEQQFELARKHSTSNSIIVYSSPDWQPIRVNGKIVGRVKYSATIEVEVSHTKPTRKRAKTTRP